MKTFLNHIPTAGHCLLLLLFVLFTGQAACATPYQASLRSTIRSLDKPLLRYIHRDSLATAYYRLGRSLEDSCGRIAEAADCYIACDRLRPSDPLLRGRVNACMAYLCTQKSRHDLSLVFNQRSTEAFRQSGDTLYYAYGLLYLSENYSQLHQPHTADSLWHKAQAYDLGTAYRACLLEMRGAYFYELQQYDSALHYLLQAAEYPRDNEGRCYNYMRIMQAYTHLGQEPLAYPYAEYVISHSADPYYRSNAYYVAMNKAVEDNDIDRAATYAHAREDDSRAKGELQIQYRLATNKCGDYIANPYPDRPWQIAVAVLALVFCVLCVLLVLQLRRRRRAVSHKDALLHKQHLLIQQQAETLETNQNTLRQMNEALQADRTEDFLLQVRHLREVFPEPRKEWSNYTTLKHDTNPAFLGLCNALEQRHLQENEIRFCVYFLLYEDAPLSRLAAYIYHSPNGIRTTKGRIAHKLGTTAANLRTTLLSLAV